MSGEQKMYFSGGRVLVGDMLVDTTVLVEGNMIAAIGSGMPPGAREVDLAGAMLLPGMVDVHGDAFERQISPRPNVRFPLDLAMEETDRQLRANGITTAYHGLTLSWEPGLRSVANGEAFLDAFARMHHAFGIDHRIQLRWEIYALEAAELVESWLAHPLRPALAFNDHTTSTIRGFADGMPHKKVGEWASRAGLDVDTYREMVVSLADRQHHVPDAIARVAALAREHGAAILSHDDLTREERQRYRRCGATVSEFPLAVEAAEDAISAGEHVVLGAPNVVRGGSHIGAIKAEDAIADGLCTVLASDYYYPAMLKAAEMLSARLGLPAAWRLVSASPAAAMRLSDRGEIATGRRADLLMVEESLGRLRVVQTYSAGP